MEQVVRIFSMKREVRCGVDVKADTSPVLVHSALVHDGRGLQLAATEDRFGFFGPVEKCKRGGYMRKERVYIHD